MIKPHLYLKIKNKKIEVPDLINEIEPIFSNVEPENNGYNFSLEVIVLFGCFYHNYLYEDVRTHKKIVFDPKEVTENSYLLSSTLDRANNYLKLKEAYENVVKFSSVKRINLNFLIRKIELLEPLISP